MTILLMPLALMVCDKEDGELTNLKHKFSNTKSLSGLKATIIQARSYFLRNYKSKPELYKFYKNNISDRFKESPSIPNILYGKEGWLFIGDKHNDAFSEAKGILKFTDSELDQITKNIEECKKWCEKEKIQFYIVVPPGKHTVYKDYLPYLFKKQTTKLDQLISVFPGVIDLRFSLDEEKKNQINRLYFKTDTHWNELGAFVAYQEIMRVLKKENPSLKIINKEGILRVDESNTLGDIRRMLGDTLKEKNPKVILKYENAELIKKQLRVPDYHRFNYNSYEMRFHNENSGNKQKIMFLRDSYGTALKKYFSNSFNEALFIYNPYFDKELIKKEKPDIFVYEITERFIDRLLTIHSK